MNKKGLLQECKESDTKLSDLEVDLCFHSKTQLISKTAKDSKLIMNMGMDSRIDRFVDQAAAITATTDKSGEKEKAKKSDVSKTTARKSTYLMLLLEKSAKNMMTMNEMLNLHYQFIQRQG